MTRLPYWNQRLRAYLRAVHQMPFGYGTNDCGTFTAGAIKAMTGQDPMRGYRGYRTLKGAMRKLQAKGHADHVALAAALYPECPPALAQVGDLAVVQGKDGLALGIVQGSRIYAVGADGLGVVPLTAAIRAFRIG